MPKPPNFDESTLGPGVSGGGSMLNILCSLIGHHRSRKHLRPTAGTWQSECTFCGTRLQRIGPQHWVPVAELPEKGASAA